VLKVVQYLIFVFVGPQEYLYSKCSYLSFTKSLVNF